MADLTTKIGDMVLKNPVLVASGTFGYGEESSSMTDLNALGGIVTKSVTLNPRDGNPPPRIFELPSGMLNSIGLANVGVEKFISQKLPFLSTLSTKIIVNVAGSTNDEFLEVIKRLDGHAGIDAYELNFSCPNVKQGGLAFSQEPAVTAQVTAMIRKATNKPVIVKLTPNVTNIGLIAKAAKEAGADAVSLINTLVGMAVNVKTRMPQIYTGTAGYSGPAIKPIALAKVFEVARAVDMPIIGIGGIMSLNDLLEFLITGATAIQIGTANFVNPAIGEQIAGELLDYCDDNKIKQVGEIVGSLQLWDN